jgi:hypothetical protein
MRHFRKLTYPIFNRYNLPVSAFLCYDRKHMKRKIFFLISLAGLIVVVIAIARFLNNRGPKQGELRIESMPTASIFLDNNNIGKTPYKEKVNTGEYTLKLVPESATSQLTIWQGKVTIGYNLLTYVNATMNESELTTAVDIVWLEKITSKQSELSVTTSPDGATVLVDDVIKGITPLSLQDIAPGDHVVSITNVGFVTRTLKIKTTPGYRLIANLKLALSSGATLPSATPSGSVTPSPTGKTKAATVSAAKKTEPAKPYVRIKDTPTGFLRVRIEPSTSATEAGRVNPGEMYTIIDNKNGWYEINFDGTNEGWVSGQYTEKVE